MPNMDQEQCDRARNRLVQLLRELYRPLEQLRGYRLNSATSRLELFLLIPDEDKVRVAAEYLHDLGLCADAKRLVRARTAIVLAFMEIWFNEQASSSTSDEIAKMVEFFGPFPVPADNEAEHKYRQDTCSFLVLGCAVSLRDFIGGLLINLGADRSEMKTKVDRRDIQRRLLELCKRGEPYTSLGELAERMVCGRTTISEAIKESVELLGWQAQYMKAKRSPRASSLADVVTDNIAQTTESDPADLLTDEDIDQAMHRLIEEAEPDEKARLIGLSEDERRTLMRVFYEQNLVQEPSPLEDDPLGCKPQRVVHYKRL